MLVDRGVRQGAMRSEAAANVPQLDPGLKHVMILPILRAVCSPPVRVSFVAAGREALLTAHRRCRSPEARHETGCRSAVASGITHVLTVLLLQGEVRQNEHKAPPSRGTPPRAIRRVGSDAASIGPCVPRSGNGKLHPSDPRGGPVWQPVRTEDVLEQRHRLPQEYVRTLSRQ